jgi:hypothetical protein
MLLIECQRELLLAWGRNLQIIRKRELIHLSAALRPVPRLPPIKPLPRCAEKCVNTPSIFCSALLQISHDSKISVNVVFA